MIKEEDITMLSTSAWTLSPCLQNLMHPPSSFLLKEERCCAFQGVESTYQFVIHARYLWVISLTTVCTLTHLTFTFLLLGILLLGVWGLLMILELAPFLFGGFLSLFFPLECTLEYPKTKSWSLEGLMVPIMTNLSCSWVKDSMKFSSEGVFINTTVF